MQTQPPIYPADLNNLESPMDDAPVFAFKDTNTRLNFVKKVYGILFVQLFFTAGLVGLTLYIDDYKEYCQKYLFTLIPAVLIMWGCFYALIYSKTCARKTPTNYILLGVITLCMSYICSFYTAFSKAENITIALATTAVMTLALTIYAMTTKTDVTMCGGFLFSFSVVLIAAGLMYMIFPDYRLAVMISAAAVVLLSLYIVYDTQLIVGGKKHELQLDDYILGAMILYLDIIYLFLEVLKLLQRFN